VKVLVKSAGRLTSPRFELDRNLRRSNRRLDDVEMSLGGGWGGGLNRGERHSPLIPRARVRNGLRNRTLSLL
jgi:hypothetical protein